MQDATQNNNSYLKPFDQLSSRIKGSATDWPSFFKLAENASREFKFDAINEIGEPLEMSISRVEQKNEPVIFKGNFFGTLIIAEPMVEVMFNLFSEMLLNPDEFTSDSVGS